MSVLAPADDALVVGRAEGHVDVLGAVPYRQAIGLVQELVVAGRLVPDRLVRDEPTPNLRIAGAPEPGAHVTPRHDHDPVPVEIYVAALDAEAGARGVDGEVAVLDHEDARAFDGALEVQPGEVRGRVELAPEVDELRVRGRAQAELLPDRRVARAAAPRRRERRRSGSAHRPRE